MIKSETLIAYFIFWGMKPNGAKTYAKASNPLHIGVRPHSYKNGQLRSEA